jgi:hypothetical protein
MLDAEELGKNDVYLFQTLGSKSLHELHTHLLS